MEKELENVTLEEATEQINKLIYKSQKEYPRYIYHP